MSEQQYSEEGYWEKIKTFAKQAGREVIGSSLNLYYAAQREDTPAWAKATIYGALAYFVLPIDAIPDITPVVGFSDDLGALAAATAIVAAHINAEVKQLSQAKLGEWFD